MCLFLLPGERVVHFGGLASLQSEDGIVVCQVRRQGLRVDGYEERGLDCHLNPGESLMVLRRFQYIRALPQSCSVVFINVILIVLYYIPSDSGHSVGISSLKIEIRGDRL